MAFGIRSSFSIECMQFMVEKWVFLILGRGVGGAALPIVRRCPMGYVNHPLLSRVIELFVIVIYCTKSYSRTSRDCLLPV